MKPAPFTYHRATSIDDAIAHLKAGDAIVRPLAGGQSLVPMLNLRLAPVDKLVDLTRIAAPCPLRGFQGPTQSRSLRSPRSCCARGKRSFHVKLMRRIDHIRSMKRAADCRRGDTSVFVVGTRDARIARTRENFYATNSE